MTLTLEGRYTAKFALRLFGHRFEFGGRSGSFKKEMDFGVGRSAWRRQDFGWFEVDASVSGDTFHLGLSVADGQIPIWSQEWDLGKLLDRRTFPLKASCRGVSVEGAVRISDD